MSNERNRKYDIANFDDSKTSIVGVAIHIYRILQSFTLTYKFHRIKTLIFEI